MAGPLGHALPYMFVGIHESNIFYNTLKPGVYQCHIFYNTLRYVDESYVIFDSELECDRFLCKPEPATSIPKSYNRNSYVPVTTW